MTQKTTILGRISQLAKANINAMLDRAEDPEKMINQLVADFTNSIAEAEEAVAQTIANTRMAEQDLKIDQDAAQEWGGKAAAASKKAEVEVAICSALPMAPDHLATSLAAQVPARAAAPLAKPPQTMSTIVNFHAHTRKVA